MVHRIEAAIGLHAFACPANVFFVRVGSTAVSGTILPKEPPRNSGLNGGARAGP